MKKFKNAKEITVGVIGYGGAYNMGKAHLLEMKKAGMTPVAVAEIDKERLKVAKDDFPGIETYNSVADMLKKSDVNLITIITPHNTHAKLALQCLNAGKSVCCEKPLAITTAECDAMIAAAKKNRVVLSTYHNRHWDGCIMNAVKQIKDKNVIGDIIRIEAHMGEYGNPGDWWRSNREISGGILYDWGVHLLEYSLQLLNGNLQEVSGFATHGYWNTKWKNETNEDEGYLVARFDSGKWLSLNISTIDSNSKSEDRGWIEITGEKGSYIFNYGNYRIIKHGQGKVKTVSGKNPKSEGWRFYQNIADHFVKGEKLVITGEWARRPIHILDLAVKSVKQNKAMKAKYA